MSERKVWPIVVIAGGLAFLYLPLFVIAGLSFSDRGVALFPVEGLTLDWYRVLVSDERFLATSLTSIQVAALSTLIGLVYGTTAAVGLSRARSRLTRFAGGLYMAPVLVPNIVLGVAVAIGFSASGIRLSVWTATIGHSLLTGPLIYLLVSARLRGFDWSVVEAARVLGARPVTAFVRVTMPLLLPAIVGGALLSFALSLDNFILSFFLVGTDSTLPLLMWSMMRDGFSPALNAMATVLLGAALLLGVSGERLGRAEPTAKSTKTVPVEEPQEASPQ